MLVEDAEKIVKGGKGVFGDDYYNALCVLSEEHRNDPCPAELTKTKTLEYRGFKCRIFYNYVPPYNIGMNPRNCWLCVLKGKFNWTCPVEANSLEEAVEKIEPHFREVIDRIKN